MGGPQGKTVSNVALQPCEKGGRRDVVVVVWWWRASQILFQLKAALPHQCNLLASVCIVFQE